MHSCKPPPQAPLHIAEVSLRMMHRRRRRKHRLTGKLPGMRCTAGIDIGAGIRFGTRSGTHSDKHSGTSYTVVDMMPVEGTGSDIPAGRTRILPADCTAVHTRLPAPCMRSIELVQGIRSYLPCSLSTPARTGLSRSTRTPSMVSADRHAEEYIQWSPGTAVDIVRLPIGNWRRTLTLFTSALWRCALRCYFRAARC